MELLAPAGGIDQLKAAIYFGADAVYVAGEQFGMRARAHNFSNQELEQAVSFAHAHQVKIYVACNIFMDDADIKALPAYLEFLDSIGVDALIISDLGAFKLAQRHAPHIDIHMSTQVSISNAASANAYFEMGAKRIVCAREMSLDDLILMRKQTNPELELEVFVHGAMCMAISGRCLISAYLTGRSANKGNCAQSCRWKYTLEEENRSGLLFPIEEDDRGSYIMNAQDLNMIEHLDELAAAGISSIKIEGRNKKAFYVASVVGAYKSVLSGTDPTFANKELHKISHRPYSTGFFYDKAVQANDSEGYEMGARHMGDVLFCVPRSNFDIQICASKNNDEHLANNERPANNNGEHHATNVVEHPASNNDGEHLAPSYTLYFRCRNKICEGQTLEVLMPHQKPLLLEIKNLIWVNAADEDKLKIFEEMSLDEQEKDFTAQNQNSDEQEKGSSNGQKQAEEFSLQNLEGVYPHKVPEARRNCDIYSCETDYFIPKHSYLRQVIS